MIVRARCRWRKDEPKFTKAVMKRSQSETYKVTPAFKKLMPRIDDGEAYDGSRFVLLQNILGGNYHASSVCQLCKK